MDSQCCAVFCCKYFYWNTVAQNVVCNNHYPGPTSCEREAIPNTKISYECLK
jgi:hypothetical protein